MDPSLLASVFILGSLVSLTSAVRPLASADLSIRKVTNDHDVQSRWRPDATNDQPLIGILSQPGTGDGPAPRFRQHIRLRGNDEDEVSYIAASYVKWVESAGGRPVPVLYDDSDEALKAVSKKCCGKVGSFWRSFELKRGCRLCWKQLMAQKLERSVDCILGIYTLHPLYSNS